MANLARVRPHHLVRARPRHATHHALRHVSRAMPHATPIHHATRHAPRATRHAPRATPRHAMPRHATCHAPRHATRHAPRHVSRGATPTVARPRLYTYYGYTYYDYTYQVCDPYCGTASTLHLIWPYLLRLHLLGVRPLLRHGLDSGGGGALWRPRHGWRPLRTGKLIVSIPVLIVSSAAQPMYQYFCRVLTAVPTNHTRLIILG